MGHSFALAVTLPAYAAAILALFLGASWLVVGAILMGATALGGIGLAMALLSDDTAGRDRPAARTT